MKYHVIDKKDHTILRLSGNTRNNEAILAKKLLFPYFQKTGLMLVVNLKQLECFEPVNLFSILNGIRKEVALLKGELRLCSLQAELKIYLREHRLDRLYQIHEDEESAVRCGEGDCFEE